MKSMGCPKDECLNRSKSENKTKTKKKRKTNIYIVYTDRFLECVPMCERNVCVCASE